jgi:protease I
MAKIVFVVAQQGFRDEELFHPKGELEKLGHTVVVASKRRGECAGSAGGTATATLALREVNPADFDAVAFVGGQGASAYFSDSEALSLAKAFAAANKVVAAICIAPCILANAGLLKGRKATVFPGAEYVALVREGGAAYEDKGVVVDGRIVTGKWPSAAREFGRAIARLL